VRERRLFASCPGGHAPSAVLPPAAKRNQLMSFLLPCPNCGPRDVSEFRYSGQDLLQPPSGGNLPEVQTERWYHRFGCRRWLSARRDVRTNEVLETSWLGEEAS